MNAASLLGLAWQRCSCSTVSIIPPVVMVSVGLEGTTLLVGFECQAGASSRCRGGRWQMAYLSWSCNPLGDDDSRMTGKLTGNVMGKEKN